VASAAGQAIEAAAAAGCDAQTVQARPYRVGRARLLRHVFDIHSRHCPICGSGDLKSVAAIVQRPAIEKIPTHLRLDSQPLPRGSAREAERDPTA
jgi:hypothetical protein